MGIPGLTTHLKPYAVPTVVGCKTPDCELHRSSNDSSATNIIIDGPSFAYAIYDRLLAHKPERLTGVEAMPSYDELGKGALAFLDELQSYGLNVKHIYFDGYLPTHKRRVRIDRQRQSLRKLSNYRTVPQMIAHRMKKSDLAPLRPRVVFESGPPTLPAFRGGLHAPFIVPAVLDAISSSKYAKVTSVVPGEAEAYCASVARKTGGVILSDDSDLYVHDLGPGAFVHFDLVAMRATSHEQPGSSLAACEVIEIGLNSPNDVAKSFGVGNLRELAYQFTRGYSQTLPEAMKSAKKRQAIDQISFDDFAREYTTEPSISESVCFSSEALARLSTQSHLLDPRVSELICQLESKASHAAEAYLLSLVDDPTRSSAWLLSSSQRTFAYSVCVLSLKSTSCRANIAIEEWIRRGQDFVKQGISLLSEPETNAYASNLLGNLRTFATTFSNIPSNLIWRLYALFEVYQWHLNTNKTPPTQELLNSALTGKVHPQLKWQTIHLSAQIQAILYSLRMIHQILIYVASAAASPLSPTLNDLATTLETVPLLAQLMPSPFELASQTAALDIASILHRLANLLQDEAGDADSSIPLEGNEPAAWEQVSKKRKKSKKERRTVGLPKSARATVKSNNMFEMLM